MKLPRHLLTRAWGLCVEEGLSPAFPPSLLWGLTSHMLLCRGGPQPCSLLDLLLSTFCSPLCHKEPPFPPTGLSHWEAQTKRGRREGREKPAGFWAVSQLTGLGRCLRTGSGSQGAVTPPCSQLQPAYPCHDSASALGIGVLIRPPCHFFFSPRIIVPVMENHRGQRDGETSQRLGRAGSGSHLQLTLPRSQDASRSRLVSVSLNGP